MNICMVSPYPPQKGGVPSHVRMLAEKLSERHDVTVITYGRRGRENKEGLHFFEIPIPNIRFLRGLAFFIGAVVALRKLSKEKKFHVVHAHYLHPPGTAAALERKLFGKCGRLVMTAHGSDMLSLARGRVGGWLARKAIGSCDVLICVSEHLAGEASSLGVPERKVRVVHNGIDPKELPRGSKESLRKELRFPDGKVIAFSGKLTEAKGADIFMVLAEHLSRKGEDIFFLVVGSGPLGERMRRMARKCGIQKRVIFAGERNREEALMCVKASDVLVVTSRIEGFGLSAIEAAAMGVPVAAMPTGALTEVLSPLSCTDNLPATVMKILSSASFRKEVIAKNRQKAQAFTLERMVRETEKTYGKERKKVARKSRKPS
jgi:glycosyltransferase involved in cell wall biosynthesis